MHLISVDNLSTFLFCNKLQTPLKVAISCMCEDKITIIPKIWTLKNFF